MKKYLHLIVSAILACAFALAGPALAMPDTHDGYIAAGVLLADGEPLHYAAGEGTEHAPADAMAFGIANTETRISFTQLDIEETANTHGGYRITGYVQRE